MGFPDIFGVDIWDHEFHATDEPSIPEFEPDDDATGVVPDDTGPVSVPDDDPDDEENDE